MTGTLRTGSCPMRLLMPIQTLAAAVAAVPAIAAPATDPYQILREGYAAADGARAAMAYEQTAVYAELYEGAPLRLIAGREAIAAAFGDIFAAFGEEADLNFRLLATNNDHGVISDVGYYRLRSPSATAYGRFLTRRRAGRLFETDASSAASLADFENAAGPVMFAADDEALDSDYYDALTGDYRDANGARLRVTRSNWRLFVHDENGGAWRGLSRVSGRDWRGGARVIDAEGATAFAFKEGADAGLEVDGAVYRREAPATIARVSFASGNLTLRGDLHLPRGVKGRAPAVVLIHGSGPQDRHGYASVVELLARRFADAGVAALTFDKRGVGASEGDWESAGFEALAQDVRAARAYLASRPDIDAARIGYAGSSQAGWVAARVIADGDNPAFVMLVGAAGSALTVAEQNLYNTKVRMDCAGLPPQSVELALAQQRAFFDAKRDPTAAPVLTAATRAARADAAIGDWLFPESATAGGDPQWYDVLDPDFDPAPVWAAYPGRAYFLFGSLDDSTPTDIATQRLARLPGRRAVLSLDGAQHLGLSATSLCDGDLGDVASFHDVFRPTIDRWAKVAVRR